MTREKIKDELSDVLLNLGGLSFSDAYSLLEGDSAITFEGEDLINIAEHFYNLPRKGLWDAEKVIKWLRAHIDNYANYNIKTDECFVNDFEEDLKKAMEE